MTWTHGGANPTSRNSTSSADERALHRTVLVMAYTFDLVPLDGELGLAENTFSKVRFHLSGFQPATKVRVMGDPPRIRVRAQGGVAEVAPDLLARVEELAGVGLEVVLVRRW